MQATMTRDVLLFSSQGSSHHLTDVATLEDLMQQLAQTDTCSFETFLASCMRAFHAEYQSLSHDERSVFGEDASYLLRGIEDPRFLMLPPCSLQTHPVFETVSLYLRQIVELMVYQTQRTVQKTAVEVTGLCTGFLTAVLSSSFTSYTSKSFLEAAVDGFRLAFWIGTRASIYGIRTAGKGFCDRSWVLGVYGLSQEELEGVLESWAYEPVIPKPHPRISTALNGQHVFLTGHPDALKKFKEDFPALSSQYRPAHIHAFYHGGPEMEDVVAEVLLDTQIRSIGFPTWRELRVPIRCAATGRYLRESGEDSLLVCVLRAIFVQKGNWENTRKEIMTSILGSLDKDSEIVYRLLGFGPGSKALIYPVHSLPCHPRLSVIESVSDLLTEPTEDGIAIIGLSVNYPNGDNKQDFWTSLERRTSTATEIPSSRFKVSRYAHPDGDTKRNIKTRYGNFLKDPYGFDAAFFNISPREAKSMDPQQRLLLQAAFDALEDAGYVPDSTRSTQRESAGVYIGVATGDYVDNLRDEIDVYYSPGTLRSFLAGRVSYAFKWSGPSMVVDTACSSSAVAIYHACRAILSGECTSALAGGVNTISSPDMYIGLDRAHFLSASGQCKPWDATADGYCRGEGCGVVFLKKLKDAIAEGDSIYGVIRSVDVNQCGTSRSLTFPDHDTQAALLNKVLKSSATCANTISVVEAHGTGTQAGDTCESASLFSVFGERGSGNPLYLSSIKGNIGHTEAASGVAGLAKLLLMLENGRIPPQASFQVVNPRLEAIKAGHLTIPTAVTQWKARSSKAPRRALLNNFGASGSNAAIILEEYLPSGSCSRSYRVTNKELSIHRSRNIFNLSAKDANALEKLRMAYIEHIEGTPGLEIEDLCYSVNARRKTYDAFRSSIVGQDIPDLLAALRSGPAKSSMPTSATQRRLTVFAFPGQGGIYMEMGKELLTTTASYQASISEIDYILKGKGFPTVTPYLSGTETFDRLDRSEQIITEQLACFSVEFALARLWMSWGVMPDIVVGHSIGEYAALAIGGVLKIEDAVLLVAERAKLMTTECLADDSGMVTCTMQREDLVQLLEKPELESLEIACYNSLESHVVSGPLQTMKKFINYCEDHGIRHKKLPVPYGYHSAAMEPIYDGLLILARSTCLSAPHLRVGSSLYGRLLEGGEVISGDYFARHARQPVRFSDVMEQLQDEFGSASTFVIEAGPSASLRQMLPKTIGDATYTYLASLKTHEEPWTRLTQSLQTLFLCRYPIRWRDVYNGPTPRFLRSLPRYPLNKTSHYVEYKEPEGSHEDSMTTPVYDLLTTTTRAGSLACESSAAIGHTSMQQIRNYLKSHTVAGVPLCPASVYLEVALETQAVVYEPTTNGDLYIFEDLIFDKPYVYVEDQDASVQADLKITLKGQPGNPLQLTFSSQEDHVHCVGRHLTWPKSYEETIFPKRKALIDRQRVVFQKENLAGASEVFSQRTIYQVIFPRVVEYGQPFTTLQSLTITASGLEGLGQFQVPELFPSQNFICHPAFIDTMLHTAGFLANIKCDGNVACICHRIEQVVLPSNRMDEVILQHMEVYCSLVDIGHSYVADAYVTDNRGDLLAFIEGMSFKKVSLQSFKASLSRAAAKGCQMTPRAATSAVKASRSAPDGRQTPPGSTYSQADVKGTLRALINTICGTEVDDTTNNTLEELGIDSLLFIELVEAISERFPSAGISKADLEMCGTMNELLDVVSAELTQEADSFSSYSQSHGGSKASLRDPCASASGKITAGGDLAMTMDVVQDTCGFTLDETNEHQTLGELGVDSLLSIELSNELRQRLQLDIEDGLSELLPSMSIATLKGIYARKLPHNQEPAILQGATRESLRLNSSSTSTSWASTAPSEDVTPQSSHLGTSRTPSPHEPAAVAGVAGSMFNCLSGDGSFENEKDPEFPLVIQNQHAGPPRRQMYLFHDGSGLVSAYSKMSDLNRTVFALPSPRNVPMDPKIGKMEDLASMYIEKSGISAKSDMILGGWSFGGVLAFEVARQLHRAQTMVKGLILIDSPPPVNHIPLPGQIIDHIVSTQAQRRLVESAAAKKARAQVTARFTTHAAMLQAYNPQPEGQFPCVFIKCTRAIDMGKLCGVEYPWLSDAEYRMSTKEMWQGLVGQRVTVLEVDCNHFELFDKRNVKDMSDKIQLACDILEAGGPE